MQCKTHPVSLSTLTPDHMPVPGGGKWFIKGVYFVIVYFYESMCLCPERSEEAFDPLQLEL